MPQLSETKSCTGCSACANACPQGCIYMKADTEGFLCPEIEEKDCIHCGLCEKSCPVLHHFGQRRQDLAKTKAFCVQHQDEAVRFASTSGGAFTALCDWIFKHAGVVFGAAFDDSFQVVHRRVDSIDEINKIRTAKYAQSCIRDCFQEVKVLLKQNRYVLFSGTPCQIAGLVSFLGKEYDNLLLVDVICHGVPSPAVWQEYIRYRSQTDAQGAKPVAVNFRSKITGWPNYSVHFSYENGMDYCTTNSVDPFMRAFVYNLCLRPSCYDCQFKGISRASDFTLGDYWGVWNQVPSFNDGKGTSLVMVHNTKAMSVWNEIRNQFQYQQVDTAASLTDNPSALYSPEEPSNRKCFMDNYSSQDFGNLVSSLCPSTVPRKRTSLRNLLKLLKKKIHTSE